MSFGMTCLRRTHHDFHFEGKRIGRELRWEIWRGPVGRIRWIRKKIEFLFWLLAVFIRGWRSYFKWFCHKRVLFLVLVDVGGIVCVVNCSIMQTLIRNSRLNKWTLKWCLLKSMVEIDQGALGMSNPLWAFDAIQYPVLTVPFRTFSLCLLICYPLSEVPITMHILHV